MTHQELRSTPQVISERETEQIEATSEKLKGLREEFESMGFIQAMKKATDFKEDQYELLLKIFLQKLEDQKQEIKKNDRCGFCELFRRQVIWMAEGMKATERKNIIVRGYRDYMVQGHNSALDELITKLKEI